MDRKVLNFFCFYMILIEGKVNQEKVMQICKKSYGYYDDYVRN